MNKCSIDTKEIIGVLYLTLSLDFNIKEVNTCRYRPMLIMGLCSKINDTQWSHQGGQGDIRGIWRPRQDLNLRRFFGKILLDGKAQLLKPLL